MSISLSILAISLIIAVMLFKTTFVGWMSFILILTFSSGMMLLFIYTSSLTPNEKTKVVLNPWFLLAGAVLGTMMKTSTSSHMKVSMKMFSNQTNIICVGVILILTMVSITLHGHSPTQATSASF